MDTKSCTEDVLSGTDFEETAMQQELKIQFYDANWLGRYCLHSNEMAMDYFYLSPFYSDQRKGTLNELIRAGDTVEPEQDGLLFEVTYNNLPAILPMAPEAHDAKHMYLNQMAIFHIKLISRRTRFRRMLANPIKVYCILQSKLYRLPSLSDVCWYRMFHAARFMEKCFDEIQSMSEWNLMEGYGWNAGNRRKEASELVEKCEAFTMMGDRGLEEFAAINKKPKVEISHKSHNDVRLQPLYNKGTTDIALNVFQAEMKEALRMRREALALRDSELQQ